MARIYVTEPGPTGGVGNMGTLILTEALRRAGHDAHHVRLDKDAGGQVAAFEPVASVSSARQLPRPDAWFVSTLYPRQWCGMRQMFAMMGLAPMSTDRHDSDPLVAFGGQSMIAPAALVPFADVLALGDGEVTGPRLAQASAMGRRYAIDMARDADGGYSVNRSPMRRVEAPILTPIVTQRDAGSPSVELARGCASKCSFCPIGWAGGTYREAPKEAIREIVSRHAGRRLNTFAPDYSSVSYVDDVEDYLASSQCKQAGRDSRLDAAARILDRGAEVRSFSFGIEGMSARLRAAIGKSLHEDAIVAMLERLSPKNVKLYVICGLPGEGADDLTAFLSTLRLASAVYSGRLEITLSMLQPVPHTPLQWVDGAWSQAAYDRAMAIRQFCRDLHASTGLQWSASQPKGANLHEHDVVLQRGDERIAPYLLQTNDSQIASGRWRDRIGVDVDSVLAPIVPGAPTAWDWVDVGTPRQRVLAGLRAYESRLQAASLALARGPA